MTGRKLRAHQRQKCRLPRLHSRHIGLDVLSVLTNSAFPQPPAQILCDAIGASHGDVHVFLARTVRYLAEERGIRQFLDIGTGIPASNNTHEVAQSVAPEARVVYVDNDRCKSGCAHGCDTAFMVTAQP